MTTDIRTTETSETVELPDRSISELLSLGTYQGMTDSEIELLLEWKIQNAVSSENNKAIREQNARTNALILQSQQAMIDETRAALDSLRSIPLSLKSVEGAETV